MASSRKRWRQQLPSIESLLEDAQQSDESFANLKSGLDVISHTRAMDFGKEKLQSLNEAEKICWVFGNYAASTVAALYCALRSIDGATTESQRGQILGQISGLSPSDATALGRFIERECVSLVGLFASQSNVQVLAPPVNTCYECEEMLVANHKCKVKYYTNAGVTVIEKFTLRCTTCSLFYNYAQYGNKRVRGFRHYPAERPAVEASDTTYFDRRLLEFQCNLA